MKRRFPILIVEDDSDTRRFLERILAGAGYRVDTVKNGREALELFEKDFFPIVLSDWMMPEMNGLELCRAIRKKEKEGYVFIILLTANKARENIVSGLEAGADDYLTKPFDRAELFARLNTGMRILNLEQSLKEANREIKLLSVTDPLTGAYNRSYLTEHLPRDIAMAKRYNHPFSMILCDIDHFKRINDTFGHPAGDLVLKEFVLCAKGIIREEVDTLIRYGGEEFLILLPETPPREAERVAERFREAVALMAVSVGKSIIRFTASFGVTGFAAGGNKGGLTPEEMIRQTDNLLYAAKHAGRNMVVAGRV